MTAIWRKLRDPWAKIRKLVTVIVLVILTLLLISFLTWWYDKTIWDLIELLVIPLALTIIALLFNRAERTSEQTLAQQQREHDRTIADDRNSESALQMYLDRMTELILERGLRESEEDSGVRDIARARTLTVLRSLDRQRRGAVLQFLHDSGLINADDAVINLDNADLACAALAGADLEGASLRGANLRRADLTAARLTDADLTKAWLTEARLHRAEMDRATLVGAHMTEADLSRARLSEADMGSDDFAIQTDLLHANLRQAQLYKADLRRAELRMADLTDANLGKANLEWADLTDANLSGAWLRDANLTNTILDGITQTKDTKWPTGFTLPVLPADRAETWFTRLLANLPHCHPTNPKG